MNYHTDGFSSFDWFLHYGFVPSSLAHDYTRHQVAIPVAVDETATHPVNDAKYPDIDGDEDPKHGRLIGKRFTMQEERSKKWRRERGLPEDATLSSTELSASGKNSFSMYHNL